MNPEEELFGQKFRAWRSRTTQRKPSNQPPLQERWVTVIGPDTLPLLDKLRAAHRASHRKQPFLACANGILRRVSSNLPDDARRRREYVKGCIRKMTAPEPKPLAEGPLYPKLEKRVGKAMAREFFAAFFEIPIHPPGASEDKIAAQFEALAEKALRMPHSGAFLRKVISDARKDRK
jgi:hypothetical protein